MAQNEKFAENKAMSQGNVDKATRKIEAAANDHTNEAAANTEEILKLLTQMWAEKAFTPEQSVFALALATINVRETYPDKFGGKDAFDKLAYEARKYYDANK